MMSKQIPWSNWAQRSRFVPHLTMPILSVFAFLFCLLCMQSVDSTSRGPSRSSRLLFSSGKGHADKDGVPSEHVIADAYHNPLIAISRKQCLKTHVGRVASVFQPVLRGRGLLCELDTNFLLKACKTLEEAMRMIGQKQSAKVVKTNINKVEAACKRIPRKHRGTVIEILEYEKEMGIHKKGGVLKDPSGSMGLLWIRRSLAFQYRMYELIVDYPKMDSVEAATQAYNSELRPNHGWSLQRLYIVALKATMPPRREMLCRIGGFKSDDFGTIQEEAVIRDLRALLKTWKPILTRWKNNHVRLDLEDPTRV